MIFSIRELDIALRALEYLADQPAGILQPLSIVAQECQRSERALARIFQLCAQAGLAHAKRGPKGGFCLSRPLEQMTVYQVIFALCGEVNCPFCPYPHCKKYCKPQSCHMNTTWCSCWQAMKQAFHLTTVAELVKQPTQSSEETQLPTADTPTLPETHLIGRSAAMQRVREVVRKVASTDDTILLLGETGTGKDLVARLIHQASPRQHKPLVSVNCASIPSTLFENELFGHCKGAYTGARQAYEGAFQQAEGGALYLDEISEMPLDIQPKLLRAVEQKSITPLGGNPVKVDVRILAATNRDLKESVRRNEFRADLFYRLNGVTIHLPPLRERKEDVACLIDYFLERYAVTSKRDVRLSADAYVLLEGYSWPGNVRELESLIKRALLLTEKPVLDAADFSPHLDARTLAAGNETLPLQEALERYERQYLQRVLEQTHGDKAEAARRLGIAHRTLYRKLEKYGL